MLLYQSKYSNPLKLLKLEFLIKSGDVIKALQYAV